MVSPEWLAIRAAVLEALAAHPGARAAVAQRLAALAGPVMANPTEPRRIGSSLASVGERTEAWRLSQLDDGRSRGPAWAKK